TRALGIAGVALALMPALAMAIAPTAPASEVWVRTAVTWWVPYLGYFILGYAVRRAPLRAGIGWSSLLAFIAGCAWVSWQWRQPSGVGAVLEHYQPAESYFHPAVAVSACSALYLSRWLVRPGAAAAALARPGPARFGRLLGSATLGVFGVHQLVLAVVERAPVIGGGPVAASPGQLIARCAAVLTGAYIIAMLGGRIPLVRRLV
ncbi:MAG: hypothetical protein Q4P32_12975, partial [Micrococcales bacterium]|nr:hypothetical protein [Micrococcales bacterium]